jgi:hypothetical protein
MAKQHTIFLSHAHADNALCDRYVEALRARGLDVWYDRHNMQAGVSLSDDIERELHTRSAFVVMLTPASVGSYWVKLEIAAFRDLASRDASRLMLPVRVGNCDVPLLLRGLKWLDAVALGLDATVDEMAKSLGAPARPSPAPAKAAPSAPPSAPPRSVVPPITSTPARNAAFPGAVRVVDAKGGGQYRTIMDAVRAAKDGDRILVRPGAYKENVTLNKSLELVGEGKRDDIMISAPSDKTIHITGGHCRIANLTLRNTGGLGSNYTIFAGAGRVELESCDLSGGGTCAFMLTDATIRRNVIHDCPGFGIKFSSKSQSVLEDNDFVATHMTSVNIIGGSHVTVRRNRITRSDDRAIRVAEGATCVAENNDLRGNKGGVWNIEKPANVTRNGNQE